MADETSKIELYYQQLMADVKLTLINLHDRSLECAGIKAKWVKIYHDELRNLKKAKKAEKTVIESLMRANPNRARYQIEQEMASNDKVQKLREYIEEQEALVAFLKDVVNTVISQFGYEISSAVRLMGLEQS